MTTQNLVKAQKEETWIKRPFENKKNNDIKFNKTDNQKEETEEKIMLQDVDKLELDENDLLCWRTIDDRK